MEELDYNLPMLFRWFVGLNKDDRLAPDDVSLRVDEEPLR